MQKKLKELIALAERGGYIVSTYQVEIPAGFSTMVEVGCPGGKNLSTGFPDYMSNSMLEEAFENLLQATMPKGK